jgi:hypothetical protein
VCELGPAHVLSIYVKTEAVLCCSNSRDFPTHLFTQLIYNDQRVKAHYFIRLWVCVSDLFDIERMTKEIARTICDPNFDLSSSKAEGAAEEPKVPSGVG